MVSHPGCIVADVNAELPTFSYIFLRSVQPTRTTDERSAARNRRAVGRGGER